MEPEDSFVDDYYYGAQSEVTQREQLSSLLGILRKRWMMILTITILGTAIVVIYEARKPDYYTAEVRIQVNNETNPATGGNNASSIVLNSGNDPAYFTTQLQILEGAGLLRRVVKTMDLEHNDAFFRAGKGQSTSVWQNVLRMFGLSSPRRPSSVADAPSDRTMDLGSESIPDLDGQAEVLAPYVNNIKRNLEVNPVKDNRTASKETRLIKVGYTHADPVLATKVVNTLADT
jgi:uncharacterized protein involved in exopolysaccharide biosynthesis